MPRATGLTRRVQVEATFRRSPAAWLSVKDILLVTFASPSTVRAALRDLFINGRIERRATKRGYEYRWENSHDRPRTD